MRSEDSNLSRPARTNARPLAERKVGASPQAFDAASSDPRDAYERYLLNCSDYLKRQMMIYEHWPQRRYDSLGYRNEKVFTDMNS